MKHGLSQRQKLAHKMALTPQMRQSIALLGMSTHDLNEYVDSALSANPFLKKDIGKKETEIYPKSSLSQSSSSGLSEEYDYISNIKHEENPRLTLISQIKMLDLKDKTAEIAEYLIYEMDDNGYIKSDLEEVAESFDIEVEEVEEALLIIQSMEPAGIGARDVLECLKLQLERNEKKNSLEYTIVSKFINELARNDISSISKALNLDKEKIQTAIRNIKKLNPQPASSILAKKAQKVIPDLIAEIKNKKIYLRLNEKWLPCLCLYNPYENDAKIVNDIQSKKFIKENMDSAKRLIDNLTRREKTIHKVADYILHFQSENILDDKREIKTLTIQDVAKAQNLHASTISRVVSNKYIEINNHVVPLKALLSKGITKKNGEITSKTAIKTKIKTLLQDEDKARPLTDEDIKKRLEEEGIFIKRRTIAKYRNSLRILPAHFRKKLS